MQNADNTQIGGNHYKQFGNDLQHWNVAIALNWDYLTGAATKYLWRLGFKGDEQKALEDLDKAIHYLQKKREVMAAKLSADIVRKQTHIATSPVSITNRFDLGQVVGEAGPGYVNQDR